MRAATVDNGTGATRMPVSSAVAMAGLLASAVLATASLPGLIKLTADPLPYEAYVDSYGYGGHGPRISSFAESVIGLQFWVFLFTAVAFLVWFARAHANARAFARREYTHLRHGRTILLLGWFIPIAGLWLPKSVANDVFAHSRPAAAAAHGRPGLALLGWWWFGWLVLLVTAVPGLLSLLDAVDGYGSSDAEWAITWQLLMTSTAVLAMLVVAQVTLLQHAKIEEQGLRAGAVQAAGSGTGATLGAGGAAAGRLGG